MREVLAEVKATGVGDNKNMLLELNIEQTRHNEIQILGNGEWCVSLGGRDCSLQMHEQKLVEVSVTQEGLEHAIAQAQRRRQRREGEGAREPTSACSSAWRTRPSASAAPSSSTPRRRSSASSTASGTTSWR